VLPSCSPLVSRSELLFPHILSPVFPSQQGPNPTFAFPSLPLRSFPLPANPFSSAVQLVPYFLACFAVTTWAPDALFPLVYSFPSLTPPNDVVSLPPPLWRSPLFFKLFRRVRSISRRLLYDVSSFSGAGKLDFLFKVIPSKAAVSNLPFSLHFPIPPSALAFAPSGRRAPPWASYLVLSVPSLALPPAQTKIEIPQISPHFLSIFPN